MEDSSSDEFKDLAKIYIDAFKKSFLQDDTSEIGTSTISFADVRVVGFILDNSSLLDDSYFRWVMNEVRMGFGERVDTFFAKDVAPGWASTHGPLYGNYRDI